jgi:hypothetical protein
MDLDGITFAALKGLASLVREQAATIAGHTATIADLTARLVALESP